MRWSRIPGARAPRREAPLPVVLYTRAGCHLCDEMKAAIELARDSGLAREPFELEEVDVELDPELERLHGLSVPVLAIGGRVAFKGRLSPEDFARKLARRAAERGRG